MIDLTAKQLTWVVLGACSLGGTGYLSITDSINQLDNTAVVTKMKTEVVEQKLKDISIQLTRLEDKIDTKLIPAKECR